VTGTDADFVGSCTATAVTVTAAGDGTVAGAMYTPAAEIVPMVELPPGTPFTCQVTDVFDALATVAVNAWLPPPACTVAPEGATATDTGGADCVKVTVAEPDRVESTCDTALTVTVADDGIAAGEAYWPTAEIVPTCVFPPTTPSTSQVTAPFAVLLTLTVKPTVEPPSGIVAVPGVTVTAIGGEVVPFELPDPEPPPQPVRAPQATRIAASRVPRRIENGCNATRNLLCRAFRPGLCKGNSPRRDGQPVEPSDFRDNVPVFGQASSKCAPFHGDELPGSASTPRQSAGRNSLRLQLRAVRVRHPCDA
jgi:hypothetical protein